MSQEQRKQPVTIESVQDSLDDLMVFLKDTMVTKEEFIGLDGKVDYLEKRVGSIENSMVTKEEFDGLEKRVGSIQNHMVTKSYLDDKLANLASESGDRLNRHVGQDKEFKDELLVPLREQRFPVKNELKRLTELV